MRAVLTSTILGTGLLLALSDGAFVMIALYAVMDSSHFCAL